MDAHHPSPQAPGERAALLVDANGLLTQVSPELCAAAGRSAAELIGTSLADLFDRTERERLQEQTRRQNLALADMTTFLNNVLESSTEYAIIATDLDGLIQTWNEGARRIYGHATEEVARRRNIRILCGNREAEKAVLWAALRDGKAEGVFENVRNTGERFLASTVTTLRRNAAGNPVGYVRISRDITLLRSLEDQLRRTNEELAEQNRREREASRLKSEFLANMSHELRTPLNGIIGFAELMHDGKVGAVSAQHREFLGDILTSARHLLQLINDVLDLSRIESGKIELRPERVDLARTVTEVRDILRTLAAQKRITIEVQVDPDLGTVVVDPAKLKQVLYNYLSNAIKFTSEGGRVNIRVAAEGPAEFRVTVEDTGIGIRAEDLARLFVEFQQLESGASRHYSGTGLGLALTRRLVEAQGGRVGVSSTSGKGSDFFAVLPRVVEAGEVPQDTDPESVAVASGASKRSILVIEDEPTERAWLKGILTEAGYAVETAATGTEALEQCRRKTFNAITLDVFLPDLSSRELLQALQAGGRNAHVPVIVVTVVAERGVAAGFNVHDFLVKPIHSEDLLASLKRAGVSPDGTRTILVVDDDPVALKVMDATLSHLGYRPRCVADGASGLRAVELDQPEAVILDLLMPGMDGFEFLERFRSTPLGARIPVLIWTVKELTPEDRTRLRATTQSVLSKGTGVHRLLDELRQHLGDGAAR